MKLKQSYCDLNKNLLPFNGEAYYYPGLFTQELSELYLKALLTEVPWIQEPIKIFGKEVMQPRLTAWYGDSSYRYSGITMDPIPWSEKLLEIKDIVEAHTNQKFNSALLNHYRDGNDSVGWHRDNEKTLGPAPVIASVSFGVKRVFHLRPYREKSPKISIQLESGSLLLMQGETQHFWEHTLPKLPKSDLGPRVNLTFRAVSGSVLTNI